MDDNISIVIVLCASIVLVFMVNKTNNKLRKIYNRNNIIQNTDTDNYTDNYTDTDTDNLDPFEELIKETHNVCPVMDTYTKLTSCIHYPPLNRGFIVSACCKHCIETIQKSFKMADRKYTIENENGYYYLYKNGFKTQMVPECNVDNMKLTMKLVKTKLLN